MDQEIKKIVELGIDIDNMDESLFEEFGTDVISLVEKPAIEESFMFFSRYEFVYPEAGETEDEFIGRCMGAIANEFPETDQRYAVCQSYWAEGPEQFEEACKGGCSHPEMSLEFETAVINWAENNGETMQLGDVMIDMNKEEFSTVGEVLDGLRAADVLQRMNVERDAPAEVYYRYQGSPNPERTFCKAMMRLANQGKMFTREQINNMDRLNPQFARKDQNSYSIFQWKGGKNCNHYWQKLAVFKNNEGQRVILVLGPVTAAEENASQTWAEMFSSDYAFQVVDEEKRMVYGPVMVPNRMILRYDEKGEPFYIYFTAKTIRKMMEKFLKQNKLHNTDVEHDGNVTNLNTLVECWVSDDPTYDKSYKMGWLLPKGTWFVGYKINDEETWQLVKERKLRGFSLAGKFLNRVKDLNA